MRADMGWSAIYLESDANRARLAEPELYPPDHKDKLVILDEGHRLPGLFQNLGGLIDRGWRRASWTGGFLFLGSAAIDFGRAAAFRKLSREE